MAESTDDQAFRSMLESGWKNIGRKGSRAKVASTISKALEEVEPAKVDPVTDSSTGKDVIATASTSSTSMGSSSHKLGSWGKLLSKASVGEPVPETEVQKADDSAATLVVEPMQVIEEAVPQASPSPVNDEEGAEEMLEDPVGEAEDDAVEEEYAGEDYPEATGEEIAEGEELVTEAMDVEEYDEAQEVMDSDIMGDDAADVQENADEMEEEEAAALAALEGKVSGSTQQSDLAEEAVAKPAAPKPAVAKVSTAKPATPKPAVAKIASMVEKPSVPKASTQPAADDDDDCIIVDDDDGNTAGAEFRDAFQDLPSGKVMKTQAKAQIKPKPHQPKPPVGAPPKAGNTPPKAAWNTPAKAPGNTPAKAPGKAGSGDNKTGKFLPPVRTPSGNLGLPPLCKKGHPIKLFRNDGGYHCDNCGNGNTTHRCSSGCDYDLCQKCFFAMSKRTPGGNFNLRAATPINVGKADAPKVGKAGQGLVRAISGQANLPKAGIQRSNSSGSIIPLNRTNSGNAGPANSPKLETKISGGKIIRTNSGNVPSPLVRTNSGNAGKITPNVGAGGGGEIKRINSASIVPDLKRTNSGGIITPQGAQGARNKQPDNAAKRARTDTGPIAAVDGEGRRYNLSSVVVNFANVGASYAKKVLKRDSDEPQMLFDWEGVRRCVNYLAKNLGLKVVGVIYENFWATDNNSKNKVELPMDIRKACESVEETPRIVGKNHGSADDEMTIKCAYHRNCRFMDNDNYRDWKQQLRDEKCRTWLDKCQDLLHMRYYFDSSMGVFETLDGNVPPGLLAPDGKKIPMAVTKRDLWTASNK